MVLEAQTPPSPLYARFSRRIRGILVDWMITMAVIFGAIFIAITVGNDNFSRALGLLVIIGLLLYEPVLVSATGGTLGHYFNNLRVVDERNGGNVSFLKACARIVIKGLLGWYSFVILAATRRNQAVHDLLTRSTVQIRDPAKAHPGQYITERAAPAASGMPSPVRRAAIICGYLLLLLIAFVIAVDMLLAAGVLSYGCLNNDYCSGGESLAVLVASIALLVMVAVVIAFGWKGKLFGARRG
jgi:uncharacterized RDD family membrane protein YckC